MSVPAISPQDGRGEREVVREGYAVWTLRDGKAVRIRFYPNKATALEAAGLRG